MDIRINQLKLNFTHIIDIRSQVTSIFDILQVRIDKLKTLYSEFIRSNRDNLFIFGLDSFHFQSKILDIEYDDMKRLFLAINNRIYCEYFKLYNIIVAYVCETIKDKKVLEMFSINNSFPVYKDLEPFKQYKFEIVQEIHENILLLLSSTNNYIINKEHELKLHQGKQDIGLNIDNFVNTFNYNVTSIRDKTLLFITYVEFFHKLHTKYLRRFAIKVQAMYNQINNDINFDENNGGRVVSPTASNNLDNVSANASADTSKPINKLQQGVKKVISGISAFKQLTTVKEMKPDIVTNAVVEVEPIKEMKPDIAANAVVEVEPIMTNSFKEESNILMEIIESNKQVIEEKPIETLMDELEKKCDEVSQGSNHSEQYVSSQPEIIINTDDNISVLTQESLPLTLVEAVDEVKEAETPAEVEEVKEVKKRGRPKKVK